MNQDKKITGEKIYLLPITKEFTPLIVQWRNNERVFNNFIFDKPFTEKMHNEWMEKKVKTGQVVQFIIFDMNDMPIGSVYFRDIDYETKQAEYGVFIGEDNAIGKGYGKEVAKLAIQYAFEELNLDCIILRVFADNYAAIKSYKSAGFIQYKYVNDAVKKNNTNRDLIFMKKNRV